MEKINNSSIVCEVPVNQYVEGVRFTGSIGSIESGRVYEECVFENILWAGAKIKNVFFIKCKFINNTFDNVVMSDCLFQEVEISDLFRFNNSELTDTKFSGVLAENIEFYKSHLNFSTWHQIALRQISYRESQCVMGTYSESQFQSLMCINSKIVDEGVSGLKSGMLIYDGCDINRQIFGHSNLARLIVKNTSGNMVRYFKSDIGAVDFSAVAISQMSFAEVKSEAVGMIQVEMPLMTVQNSQMQKMSVQSSSFDNAMFDGSVFNDLEMTLVGIKGGSFRGADVKRFKAGHCVLTQLDASGMKLGVSEFSNVRVENSNFTGQDKRQWGGVDFRKTEFDEKMSFEEKQWWSSFKMGSTDFVV